MTGLSSIEARLVRLFDSPEVLVLGLILAAGIGALHALAPGHGKVIAAAYLVGGRARLRDAALLGSVVAVMHTVSVAVLALVWTAMSAGSAFATARVTAWMQVVAALGVVAVGALMVKRRARHPRHHHHHVHRGAGDRPPSGDDPASTRGLLVALGASGGLLPSPSAFLVLVSGILTGRVLYATALVAAFALGMASTLTAVGTVTLRGRDLLASGQARGGVLAAVHRRVPVLGAAGVLTGGLVYLVAAAHLVLTT